MDRYSKYHLNSILSLKCPLYTCYVQDLFAEIDTISDVELKRLVVVIFEVIPSQQWAIIRYYIGV